MKTISLFSGAGGLDAGFREAGAEMVKACEWDSDAAATYAANFGDHVHVGDIRDYVTGLSKGDADLIIGGPPCQGYSVAGKMDPKDERSGLVYSFLDAVDRVKPTAFLMENVDALATLAKWNGTFCDIRSKANSIGYAIHSVVLNAADFGVPQNRKRMFIFGIRDGAPALMGEVINDVLADLHAPKVSAREVLTRLGKAGTSANPSTCTAKITYAKNPVLRASPYAGMMFNGAGRPIRLDGQAPTMAASAGGNKTHFVDEGELFDGEASFVEQYHAHLMAGGSPRVGSAPERLRRITVKEAMAFQTFADDFVFAGRKSSLYRQIGNAVPPLLAKAVAMALFTAVEKAA